MRDIVRCPPASCKARIVLELRHKRIANLQRARYGSQACLVVSDMNRHRAFARQLAAGNRDVADDQLFAGN